MKTMSLWIAIFLLMPAYSMERDSLDSSIAPPVDGIEILERNVYQKKLADDLYLVMERPSLNPKNLQGWKSFAKAILFEIEKRYGETALYKEDSSEYGFYRGVYETFDIYNRILDWSDKKSYDASQELQVWIAQALNINYFHLKKKFDLSLESNENDWHKDVEMTMCIIFYPTDPFQMHIGISRNIFYEGVKHPQLSLKLHSFAAQVTRLSYSEKLYMITRPLYNMWSILITHLPKNSYQEEDHPNGWIQEITHYNGPSSWVIKDSDRKIILMMNDRNRADYDWLLSEDWDVDLFSVNLKTLADLKLS
ncbi:hypothetical protein [Candidatus Odyssella acanthamoebae]|uniref:Uncharacterized protein n=1 Tax=Candidatus Odyssella acanthamoebae TaxID=91604 RepID=A0A077AYJ1_9PROT|nr:hypothetical protein [Candidatus Paracaedibacter acanthamoebae]AIK96688.1 hypothetical protein ID47_08075 [Candidatus Paracaedibacter acanthamoebae]